MTGRIEEIEAYPSPDDLWRRYCGQQGIDSNLQVELEQTPFDHQLRNSNNTPKRPRYYQRVAVNRTVRAIARGDNRLLLTLATGIVAYLIVAKLREVGWPSGRKPKVLYLTDRKRRSGRHEPSVATATSTRPTTGRLVPELGRTSDNPGPSFGIMPHPFHS